MTGKRTTDRGLVIVVTAALLVLTGCDGGEETPAAEQAPAETAPEGAVGTVKFDGSTCSVQITADRIVPGVVLFEAVNATEQRVMFDSWQLLDGYTLRAFEATIERDRRLAEAPGNQGAFPSESQVRYLGSEVIPAHGSDTLVSTMSAGPHAIVCLRRQEGDSPRFRPFALAGPIVVR